MISFADLTTRVHQINDTIITDMTDADQEDPVVEALLFSKHLCLTKHWFTRTSNSNKKNYLSILLEDMKSAWAISLLLKSLWNCQTKDSVMSQNDIPHLSSYDQVPMDHNRTVRSVKTLAQVMKNDRNWFAMQKPEKQAFALCELLGISGGQVISAIYRRAYEIYQNHHDKQVANLVKVSRHESLMKINESSDTHKSNEKKNEKKNAVPYKPVHHHVYEPGNASKDQEIHLAIWENTLKSIRASFKLEEIEMIFRDGTCNKFWKVNRPKPESSETVDMIQLLPSHISKKILLFVPRAQLGDLVKVNKYWAYLIEEVRQELNANLKINADYHKIKEVMFQYDSSLEMIGLHDDAPLGLQHSQVIHKMSSFKAKVFYQTSIKASEKSAGALSFKRFLKNKLADIQMLRRNAKPIRNMRELNDRLQARGAADDNLWKWCHNVFRIAYNDRTPGAVEDKTAGILSMSSFVFPSPLMKKKLAVPLPAPLTKEPTDLIKSQKKLRFPVSAIADTNVPKTDKINKYSLWTKDLSKLYPVVKIPSYNWPI